jgi:hypothetical protein
VADVGRDPTDGFVLAAVGAAHDTTLDVVAPVGDVEKAGATEDIPVVDGPSLDDFVGHYAIHTYLRDYREVEYPTGDNEDQLAKSVETIQRLTSRLTAVTRCNVENLRSTERLDVGPVDVITDVQVVCEDCGHQYDAVELVERGACECKRPDSSEE